MSDKKPGFVPTPATLRHEREAELGVAGAVAGAALGAVAGPPGIAVGAIVGGIAGVVAGVAAAHGGEAAAQHEDELDEAIGLHGDGLGAPTLKHPPARVGAYSSGSAGGAAVSNSDAVPAEGPLSGPSDD